ncbi:serine decarboxylase-like [Andrographis paniculata]|uniref:serine decarboxylase-like n=1 Tax=Andrographis paniculata TaxID=175694 RepID=UPI0021E80CC3|nr:serine decarboxylase-like [Andrographis paniculata]
MTRKKCISLLSTNIDYIGSLDNTISGSRSGHAPIFMWYGLSLKGLLGIQRDVLDCLKNARRLRDGLRESRISTLLNKDGVLVVFERPLDKDFVRHWQLSCTGNLAHVVVMPHVTSKMLDELVRKRKCWYI